MSKSIRGPIFKCWVLKETFYEVNLVHIHEPEAFKEKMTEIKGDLNQGPGQSIYILLCSIVFGDLKRLS